MISIGVLALLCGGFIKYNFPYGSRSCAVACLMSALSIYAVNNDETFPDGSSRDVNCLASLVPTYTHAAVLAGLSGDRDAVTRAVKEGQSFAHLTSLVYYPGFRRDTTPAVMILWDRSTNANSGAGRTSTFGHWVWFSDGTWKRVQLSEWEPFFQKQAELRKAAAKKPSAQQTATNSSISATL